MLDFFVDNTSVFFTVFAAMCLFIPFFLLVFVFGVLTSLDLSRGGTPERLRFVGLSGCTICGFIFAISLIAGMIGEIAGVIQSV